MHQHLLTVPPHKFADRLHGGMAITLAIARMAVIDMATPQTIRAVIAMSPTGNWRADELLAVHAFECLILLGSWRAREAIPATRGRSLPIAAELFTGFVLVFELVFVICE